jgi:uncharacterized membrane protein
MNKIKAFIKTSLIGGLGVLLPIAIFMLVFKWLFNLVTNMIQPLTTLLIAKSHLREIVADVVVIAVIISSCFIIGVIVRTKVGKFIHKNLENRILKIAPGYNMIREIVLQFIGKKKSPFSSVALVQIFESSAKMTAFVTDSHPDGSYTVFVPTGPNPTSGNIYHLEGKYVQHLDVPVEIAMRSIISCGAGSTELIKAYSEAHNLLQR